MTDDLRDKLQQTLGSAVAIERELSGGGMSRVFVANDTVLGRQVVVKMLPSDAVPAVSLERFRREIRTVAKLQHPHIVPVLNAGESGGLPYYTMPFVSGESLRQRLSKGGELSVNESIHVLRDVAAALAYAHGEGVVHRDIKPENVMLSGGVAVVTDFGVAKAVDLAATDAGHGHHDLTSMGLALGTPAYMSPEQATADPHVDHRSDIYSFGCVAYEMLAGIGPFAGRTPQQMLAAHVQEVPEPLLKRRPSVPPALDALVMRCLEKRPGDRPQTAQELIAALDAIATPSGGTQPTAARLAAVRPARRMMFWYAGAAVVVVGAVGVYAATRGPRPVQLSQQMQVANSSEIEIDPAISPDGKFVAYSYGVPGQSRIFVKQIAGGRPTLATGELDGDHQHASWSPDGTQIVFEAKNAAYVVPAFGGVPQRLLVPSVGVVTNPVWSPDGKKIAYSDGAGIWVGAPDGTSPVLVLKGAPFHSLAWSGDSRLIAFAEGLRTTLRNVSVSSIWIMNAAGGERHRVSDSSSVNTSPAFMPDGSLLYVSTRAGARDVYQQVLRADGRATGDPLRLTTTLYSRTISVSADGSRMAYDVVHNRDRIWSVAIPATGAASMADARQVTHENEHIESMRISHDGAWLTYDSDRNGNADIYKLKLDGGVPVQLTTNPGSEYSPSWSRDDSEIVFYSVRNGNRDIFIISADGGPEQQVTSGPRQDYWPNWSPDGSKILFGGRAPGTYNSEDLFYVERTAKGQWSEAKPFGGGAVFHATASGARWSPDGKQVCAWTGNQGDTLKVVPVDGTSRALWANGTPGETQFVYCAWRDPETVYFNLSSPDGAYTFWSIAAKGGPRRLLLSDDPTHRIGLPAFDTDGKRLFFTLAADESDVWVASLKKK